MALRLLKSEKTPTKISTEKILAAQGLAAVFHSLKSLLLLLLKYLDLFIDKKNFLYFKENEI